MTDLFDQQRKRIILSESPLATRMRPRHLDEFAGQSHILGEGRVLRSCIEKDILPSVILWGPPGCGKTSLANVIANVTSSHFESISAVTSGVSDLRKIIDLAKERRGMYQSKTILFLDEIHRFNKAQQDVVLPYVEDGTITLIGATTENPSFEVISPLISRCRIFTLRPLDASEILVLLKMREFGGSRQACGSIIGVSKDRFQDANLTRYATCLRQVRRIEDAAARSPPLRGVRRLGHESVARFSPDLRAKFDEKSAKNRQTSTPNPRKIVKHRIEIHKYR